MCDSGFGNISVQDEKDYAIVLTDHLVVSECTTSFLRADLDHLNLNLLCTTVSHFPTCIEVQWPPGVAEKDGYTDFKTPGELEDGAIIEGGALTIFSTEAMALFAQYAAIGCIYGLIPALQYPIFNNYL
ncbi:unnamed protein product, partial [Aphanomyces euteiches]